MGGIPPSAIWPIFKTPSDEETSEKIGGKIRLAQLEKVSYMLVLGAPEEQAGEIAVRSRKNGDEGALSAPEFVKRIQMEVKERQHD